jgi:hypothetical protein
MEGRKEDFILTTKNVDKAREVRSKINQNFKLVWTCVWKIGDEFKVSVANIWDGSLPADELDEIKALVSAFKEDDSPKEKN